MRSVERSFVLVGGLIVVFIAAAACDGDRPPGASPVAPTPASQPVPGEIQVAGTVSDAAWRSLGGARVEVVGGPNAGLAATTDSRGEFRLAGVFDESTRFRATKEGHAPADWPLPAPCARCNPNWWLHFHLEALAPRANIAGDYTLTLVANGACPGLPEEMRTRSYEATVKPSPDSTNSRFDVTIKGAPFVENHNRFTIGLAGDYLAAEIGDWGHGGAGLVEQVAASTYVTVAGSFAGTATPDATISGSFQGIVERCELKTEWGALYSCLEGAPVAHAKCGPLPHQLTFTRR